MIFTYRTIYRLLDPMQRRRFWWLVMLMAVASAINFFGVALILPFLTLLSNPAAATSSGPLAVISDVTGVTNSVLLLDLIGLAVLGFVLLALAAQAAMIFQTTSFARNLAHGLATRRLEIYLAQPYEWFLTRHSAELSKSVLDEVREIVTVSIQPALRTLANTLVCLTLIGLLLAVEPVGAIVMALALGAAFAAVFFAFSSRLRRLGGDRRKANRERHQVAGEILGGIKETKVMGLEAAYLSRFFEPSRRIAGYDARLAVLGELPRIGVEALTFGGMMLFTLYLLQTRGTDVQEIVPVLGAFAVAGIRLIPTAHMLFRDISQIRFGEAALRSLEDDLLGANTVRPVPSAADADVSALPFRQAIRIENVVYAYPDTRGAALDGLSLEIPAGAAVGFVGATGAGKTTVTDLILGLIEPTAGRVTVDGVPIDDDSRRRWQSNIGFVPQSIHLIDDSIARNISRDPPGAKVDLDAVKRAAELASLHEFIEGLPDGYDTPVGDAGVRLSGGQRQRLGIARALMRDPAVLVFDEATSALDPLTERAVIDAVRTLHGRKTLILVSHRLKTLSFCDTIFLLEKGRLLDAGDFSSLEARQGGFRAMLEAAN